MFTSSTSTKLNLDASPSNPYDPVTLNLSNQKLQIQPFNKNEWATNVPRILKSETLKIDFYRKIVKGEIKELTSHDE